MDKAYTSTEIIITFYDSEIWCTSGIHKFSKILGAMKQIPYWGGATNIATIENLVTWTTWFVHAWFILFWEREINYRYLQNCLFFIISICYIHIVPVVGPPEHLVT
jgi:hypothetical protein